MFGKTWHHGTLRKYVIYFGTLFNNLYINRKNSSGENIQTLKVPLNYGPKEKFLARLEGNPDLQNPIAMTLPRMAFEMTGIRYAPERKLTTINKDFKFLTNGVAYQYRPVPYDMTFQLSIMVKNAEDGTKIVEQILPYFTPEWTNTLNIMPDIDFKLDVPVILNSVSTEDSYEGDFMQRRAIIWTLEFTMKGALFGPTITQKSGMGEGGLITQVEANFNAVDRELTFNYAINNDTGIEYDLTVKVTPGLDANGDPTTNSAVAIDRSLVQPTDDYAFIIDFTTDP